jgi:hypothetical protein
MDKTDRGWRYQRRACRVSSSSDSDRPSEAAGRGDDAGRHPAVNVRVRNDA